MDSPGAWLAMASPPSEILFIAHRVPFPPDRGDKIRSYNELAHLARHAPVHLAALADDPRDLEHGAALSGLCASHCVVGRGRHRPAALVEGLLRNEPLSVSLFRNPALSNYVDRIVATRPLAAVFVYSGQMATYVPRLPPETRFVMDFCDVDSRKFAAYGREGWGPMAWINRREGRLLGRFEVATARRADASLFISAAEAALFRGLDGAGDTETSVIENGVDLVHYDPAQSQEGPEIIRGMAGPFIVFTGQMDYRPNVEAVADFATRSMPVIRQVVPNAQFLIVGRNPIEAVRRLGALPGVVVTGEVPDPRAYLAAADVVVAPLRIARGIQNKVLEAMAMACPVVASREAAEGIDALDGRDWLIARAPEDEAAMVLGLLADCQRATAVGAAARRQVERRYSWDRALSRLAPLVFGHDR